jgi:hypothetical protein
MQIAAVRLAPVLLLLSTQPLSAADLPGLRPSLMPIEAAPVAPSWNSCFVGGSLGVSTSNTTVKPDAVPQFQYPIYTTTYDAQVVLNHVAPLVGLSVGCDRMFGPLVVGVGADINVTPGDAKGMTGYADPWLDDVRMSSPVNGTLALRLGYAFGSSLIYARLGIGAALERYQQRYTAASLSYAANPTNPGQYLPVDYITSKEYDGTRLRLGPMVGVGYEQMIGGGWTAQVEADATWLPPSRSAFTFDLSQTKIQAASGSPSWTLPPGNRWGYVSQGLRGEMKVGLNRRW